MPLTGQPEEYDLVILGSGAGSKLLAWAFAQRGQRVAAIERKYIGGACPNIACLPSKNIIHTAQISHYVRNSEEFGIASDGFKVKMPAVRERKRRMVQGLVDIYTGDSRDRLRQWNVTDTVSAALGKHQIKFGIDFRRVKSPLAPLSPYVLALFESQSSMLSGVPDYLEGTVYKPVTPIFNETAAFIQDSYHLNARVNLSYGLRWEVDPPPSPPAYTVSGNLSDPTTLELAPQGTPLWKTTWFNLAPRLGLAWTANNADGRQTIVRAGGGVFYDTDNEAATSGYVLAGFAATQGLTGSSLPVAPSQLDILVAPTEPYAVAAFPAHLQLPYTLQWNVSIQQALGRNQSATISYIGSNGRRQIQEQEIAIGQLNPRFSELIISSGNVTSNYQALEAKFERDTGHGVHVLASYTWSHSIDFGSNYATLPVTRGNSDFDVRNNLQAGVSWELPQLSAKGLFSDLLDRWGVDGRLMARSAFPITLDGNYLTDPATGSEYFSNLNLVPGKPIYLHGSQYPGGRAINPDAFSLPTGSNPGDAPRNFVRGFGEAQLNFAARREFVLRDRLLLLFRAEAFNTLNHPNFGYVDPNLTDATFGQATKMLNESLGTLASQYQQGGPRSMQFALKLTF